MAEQEHTDHGVPEEVLIPFCFAEADANLLTNPQLDPMAKIPAFRYCAAKVEPVREGRRRRRVGERNSNCRCTRGGGVKKKDACGPDPAQ